ncbi:MAG: acyl phosphate:glycerol-3-phosphate acyltransferase [Chloroflexota bacterium]|jgi:glycerol-3-phosphate acyltransferase PlsY|nr:acyl phosphate:glycerol-3-phosphate acyltransferase [Chloroflexota bacterium]
MEQGLVAAALVVLGYLIGSLPMGVLVARLTGGRDPRTVGSRRTGGTNALRAMGPARALTVGLLDIAKGGVPVLIARFAGADELIQALAGIAAVLGAWRSVFLRFHGGRGVATAIGGLLVVAPLVVIISAPVFFGVIWLSGYVSLGSLLGSGAAGAILVGFVAAGWLEPIWLVYGIAAIAIVWVAHTDNIQRLIHGQERKFVFGDREPN